MKPSKSIRLYHTAGFKVAACIVASTALLGLSLLLIFENSFETVSERLVSSQVDAEADFAALVLGPQVAFGQSEAAALTLAKFREQSQGAVKSAAIVDADGEPFASVGGGDTQALFESARTSRAGSDPSLVKVMTLALPDGTAAGAIAINWTTDHISATRTSIRHQVLLGILIVGAVAAAAVLFAFRTIVSRPLSRLGAVVEQLRNKNYEFQVRDIARRDEFGVLSQSIDTFRTDLGAAVELESRARQTHAAFNATTAPLMVANPQGEIDAVNPAAVKLMEDYRDEISKFLPGFDPNTLVGRPLQYFHKNNAGLLDRIKRSAISTRIKFGEGRMRLQIQPIFDKEENLAGFVLEWQDVTQEFRDSSRIEAIERTQLCAEFTSDGCIHVCNEIFRKTAGLDANPVEERLADLIQSAQPNGLNGHQILEKALQNEEIEGLFRITPRSGKSIYAEGSIQPMRDIDESIHRLYFVARDVSDVQADLDRSRLEREQSEKERTEVVDALRSGMSKLSGGDLDAEITARFADRFEELRSDYNATVKMLQQAMTEIGERAGNIRNETKDISTTAELLSQRSESTAATLEQTAAALDELTGGVKVAAESARKASAIVADARTSAEESGRVVVRTVKAMDEIAASSEKVASIIKVIDDIAFQTNLLALNAGVEAARAGDAGRGFAVVASEVRALAQRSSDAASEINTLIGQSSAQVKSGVALVGETGNALRLIVSSVSDISDRVVDIAESAKNQSLKLEEINGAVTQLDQATQQNAARLEETTAASEALRNDASTLVETIARFRVPGAIAAPLRAPVAVTAPMKRREPSVATPKLVASGGRHAPAAVPETWTDF